MVLVLSDLSNQVGIKVQLGEIEVEILFNLLQLFQLALGDLITVGTA